MSNYVNIGSVTIAQIDKINAYRDANNQIPNTTDLDIVVDDVWFTAHIDYHYPGITIAQAIQKVTRIIQNSNHIFYGDKKKGVLYIEMNSVNKEVLVVKYNPRQGNFRGDTAYQFSSQKLVQLLNSKNVHRI